MNATELLTKIRRLAASEGPVSALQTRELADLVRELDRMLTDGEDWPRQWQQAFGRSGVGGDVGMSAGAGAFLGGVLGAVLARDMEQEDDEEQERLPPRRGRRRR